MGSRHQIVVLHQLHLAAVLLALAIRFLVTLTCLPRRSFPFPVPCICGKFCLRLHLHAYPLQASAPIPPIHLGFFPFFPACCSFRPHHCGHHRRPRCIFIRHPRLAHCCHCQAVDAGELIFMWLTKQQVWSGPFGHFLLGFYGLREQCDAKKAKSSRSIMAEDGRQMDALLA